MTSQEEKPEILRGLKKIKPLVLKSVEDMVYNADKFNVDIWCAQESDAISSLFKCQERAFPILIKSGILRAVLDFCEKRAKLKNKHMDNKELQQKLKIFESEFIKEDPSLLIDYLDAAYQLRIRSLFDLACTALLGLIDGRDNDEIIKMCNLREIFFTDEKIQWHCMENRWAFV